MISFGNAVGAMYVREYFQESARQSLNEMVKDLRAVFAEIIDQLEWMDDETRARAKTKAASMTTHIAYPDELLDDKKLIDLYANVIRIKKKKKKTWRQWLIGFDRLADLGRNGLFEQCAQHDHLRNELFVQETAWAGQQDGLGVSRKAGGRQRLLLSAGKQHS